MKRNTEHRPLWSRNLCGEIDVNGKPVVDGPIVDIAHPNYGKNIPEWDVKFGFKNDR